MKRRTRRVIVVAVAILASLLAAVILFLHLTSPNPDRVLSSIDVKALPDAWTQDPAPSEGTDGANAGDASAPVPETGSPLRLPMSGTLVLAAGDRPFGEESYRIDFEGDGVVLRAEGAFWFRALVATLTLTFDVVLELDADLHPTALASAFDGPLGFDRSIDAEIDAGRATVHTDGALREYDVTTDPPLVVATFSMYALVPLLAETGILEGEATFDTLFLGGPPRQDDAVDRRLPSVRVHRLPDGVIVADGRALLVSRFAISGDLGNMTLYAREGEFLGLLAGEGEESMTVYRADYFPSGFSESLP